MKTIEMKERQKALAEAINSFDKVTSASVSMDLDLLRENGLLNDPANYSDEKFFASIEKQMLKSNAATYSNSILLTHKDRATGEVKPTGLTAKLVVVRKNRKFYYNYRGAILPFLKNLIGWDWRKRMLLWLRYFTHYRNTREFLQQQVRELFWRSMVDWDKIKDVAVGMLSSEEVRDAAIALGTELQGMPAITGVGVGQANGNPVLVVYTQRKLRVSEANRVPSQWRGISVSISQLGKIIPAAR